MYVEAARTLRRRAPGTHKAYLSELQLAQLEVIGTRFIEPAIPHGGQATAVNREDWTSASAI
jgi:hypothetical protein